MMRFSWIKFATAMAAITVFVVVFVHDSGMYQPIATLILAVFVGSVANLKKKE